MDFLLVLQSFNINRSLVYWRREQQWWRKWYWWTWKKSGKHVSQQENQHAGQTMALCVSVLCSVAFYMLKFFVLLICSSRTRKKKRREENFRSYWATTNPAKNRWVGRLKCQITTWCSSAPCVLVTPQLVLIQRKHCFPYLIPCSTKPSCSK